MVEIMDMSYDEKVTMYSKIDKKILIEMLIEVNRLISSRKPTPGCNYFQHDSSTSSMTICKCGKSKWEHNNPS
jgi:hypothetical protein